MRTPTKAQPDKPVTYLWERHKEIARRILCGQKPIDICRDLQYTPAWMSTVMNSPVFKEYLSKLRERTEESVVDIRARIHSGADKGVDLLYQTLTSTGADAAPTSLKVKIAQDFLDRAGHGKVTKVQNETNITFLNADKLAELKQKRQYLMGGLQSSRPADDAILINQ